MPGTETELPTIADLLEGPVDLGYGVTISPLISDQGRLTAVRFSHRIEGLNAPDELCSKVIPIKGRQRNGVGWKFKKRMSGLLSMSPSIVCPHHSLHGWIEDGVWKPMRIWQFEGMSRETYEQRIERAEEIIEEYGGGYDGAVLALAARIVSPRYM